VKSLGWEASIKVMSPAHSDTRLSPCAMQALPSSWNTAKVLAAFARGDSLGVRYSRAWQASTKLSLSAPLWYSLM
jgi:hypothetical protein